MKIHFLSTIGVDYDLDLAPWWIEHYKNKGFSSKTVFLHREQGEIEKSVSEMYLDNGFKVHTIGGPYSGGKCGAFHMDNAINNFDPEDMVVVADADEFHAMGNGAPVDYYSLSNDYDILHGIFEERYTDTLSECVKNPFEQYQYVEPYTGEYFKRFTPPWLSHLDWPCVYRSKILMAKASADYRFYGMHGMYEVSASDRILSGLKVTHFAWRSGSAGKIAKKEWYDKVCYDSLTSEIKEEPAYAL